MSLAVCRVDDDDVPANDRSLVSRTIEKGGPHVIFATRNTAKLEGDRGRRFGAFKLDAAAAVEPAGFRDDLEDSITSVTLHVNSDR